MFMVASRRVNTTESVLLLYDSATTVFVTRSSLHVVECDHHVQNLHRLYTSTSICRRPMNSYSPSVE